MRAERWAAANPDALIIAPSPIASPARKSNEIQRGNYAAEIMSASCRASVCERH